MMNILVIGLGSMGKRRIRLILELDRGYTLIGVDKRDDRRKEVSDLFGILCFETINDASLAIQIDAAFVCTTPVSHGNIITDCLERHWNVFSELNLVSDGYEKNIRMAKENQCVLFLSSSFLYRGEIQYINGRVDLSRRWNYIYHIGQYLPDWHPWESYKDFFIGQKRTNGPREILALELPWIEWVFGDIKKIGAISDKLTGLEIEYHDNYIIQLIHENGTKGVLLVDVVSPVAVRRFECYTENRYIRWEGTPDTLFEYDPAEKSLEQIEIKEQEHQRGYQAFVVENAYEKEIVEFFDVVLYGNKASYSFEQDRKILDLIDSIEAY